MDQQQNTKQMMDANKILLENTFVLAQTKKLFLRFLEKNPWGPGAKKRFINKLGKIYNRQYENFEVSGEHIMALYKIANQESI